jgi:hypothetical protein
MSPVELSMTSAGFARHLNSDEHAPQRCLERAAGAVDFQREYIAHTEATKNPSVNTKTTVARISRNASKPIRSDFDFILLCLSSSRQKSDRPATNGLTHPALAAMVGPLSLMVAQVCRNQFVSLMAQVFKN